MKIAMGSDHGGYELRQVLKGYLESLGHEVVDFGSTKESSDYPVYGEKVARSVVAGEVELGIAICGTGVGISIAANKVAGARAACVSEPYSARMSRRHNDANVLCLGARVIGEELAKMIVDEFLANEFEGGRHARRVDLLTGLDASVVYEESGC